jgi:D-alanyl-D-alanine carboxypeptidase (penicillin-binding protein 5/6)
MTLLLVMEAIDAGAIKLTDMVSTSANAASMGGSQIFLEEGEQMSVEDMVKSVVISSANDAAVALAEFVAGSEEAFVERMNKRAEELGMVNTHFENTNGLDDTVENHVISARDIALMSRALIKHETILKYSSIWMDTIRDGTFGLTNTNRLVRFYKDATGLKTGSTAKAKFCVSATAKRDGMHLICVVMGADTRDIRNAIATKLLDYGFANYSLYHADAKTLDEIKVLGGVENTCGISYEAFDCIMPKGGEKKVELMVELDENLAAPVKVGEQVGKVIYRSNGEVLGEVPVLTTEKIDKISFWGLVERILAGIFMK